MVYKRKSISKMAAAAAAAAWAHDGKDEDRDSFAAIGAVIDAVHIVIPDKAPAHAAQVAKQEGATDAMCTSIAAGVAAAAVGWEYKVVQNVSRTAFKTFQDFSENGTVTPATIAKEVANAVVRVSSRYPAVEAAAAAAYSAHMSQNSASSGNAERFRGSNGSGAGSGIGGVADARADADGGGAAAAKAPAGAALVANAAVAAADAAGEAARTIGGSDSLPYAAISAARAATFRNASKKSVFAAAVNAATPTDGSSCIASPSTGTSDGAIRPVATAPFAASTGASSTPATPVDARSPANFPELAEHVAVAITAAFYGDSIATAALGACGKELLEALPNSHELIYKKLDTIVALDTFLAAFLLFSLTGRSQDAATSGEVVQTVLQAYSFAVFLAATLSAGIFMVVTGGTYALTRNDLIVPTVLSTVGFGLLLVTVADAIYLELGEGVYHDDEYVGLFWSTVTIGFLIQLFSVGLGVFTALLGSKYSWYCSRTAWPPARRIEYSKRNCFSKCCFGQ